MKLSVVFAAIFSFIFLNFLFFLTIANPAINNNKVLETNSNKIGVKDLDHNLDYSYYSTNTLPDYFENELKESSDEPNSMLYINDKEEIIESGDKLYSDEIDITKSASTVGTDNKTLSKQAIRTKRQTDIEEKRKKQQRLMYTNEQPYQVISHQLLDEYDELFSLCENFGPERLFSSWNEMKGNLKNKIQVNVDQYEIMKEIIIKSIELCSPSIEERRRLLNLYINFLRTNFFDVIGHKPVMPKKVCSSTKRDLKCEDKMLKTSPMPLDIDLLKEYVSLNYNLSSFIITDKEKNQDYWRVRNHIQGLFARFFKDKYALSENFFDIFKIWIHGNRLITRSEENTFTFKTTFTGINVEECTDVQYYVSWLDSLIGCDKYGHAIVPLRLYPRIKKDVLKISNMLFMTRTRNNPYLAQKFVKELGCMLLQMGDEPDSFLHKAFKNLGHYNFRGDVKCWCNCGSSMYNDKDKQAELLFFTRLTNEFGDFNFNTVEINKKSHAWLNNFKLNDPDFFSFLHSNHYKLGPFKPLNPLNPIVNTTIEPWWKKFVVYTNDLKHIDQLIDLENEVEENKLILIYDVNKSKSSAEKDAPLSLILIMGTVSVGGYLFRFNKLFVYCGRNVNLDERRRLEELLSRGVDAIIAERRRRDIDRPSTSSASQSDSRNMQSNQNQDQSQNRGSSSSQSSSATNRTSSQQR